MNNHTDSAPVVDRAGTVVVVGIRDDRRTETGGSPTTVVVAVV
ncbi:hypothetical protein HanRHA438_Chr10g0476991 [Helianthus annuus]|nr:hypothetical protein HanRHA438_Chr10g0476991 [Helianthus annuus]